MSKSLMRATISESVTAQRFTLKKARLHRSIKEELRTLLLAGAVVGTHGLLVATAYAAEYVCGPPTYDKKTEQETFVWQDCETEQWHLRVTAGGDAVDYAGSLNSDQPLLIEPYSFEGHDVLDRLQPDQADYEMHVNRTGQDGLDFFLAAGAGACLDTGGSIVIGSNRLVVQTPFDIGADGVCSSMLPPACGDLVYDKANEQETFLWQDCSSGQWHLRVTAGGSSTNFTGSITADQPILAIAPFSFENGDVLDTSQPGQAAYQLFVGGTGQDGLDFSLATNASACIDTGGSVVVGAERRVVASPFDIGTLEGCGSSSPSSSQPSPEDYAYLDDADINDKVESFADSDLGDRPFPRITTGNIKSYGTAERFSKYGVIAVKAFSFDWLSAVQAINPQTVGLRIHCPQEYQGFTEQNSCRQGNGMPFDWTGPATASCQIYAGHWLYAPGTTLSNAIGASTTTLRVADASEFNTGRYIVIYDGGPGAFLNAEHARVTAVNAWTNTLTLANRGFKSTARPHAAGAIVAEHTIGNGDFQEPENWAFNLSTASPRDTSGRQLNEVMAEWLANNYAEDHRGDPTSARLDGILFDSDFHFVNDGGHGRRPDVDNDLVLDGGISPAGENLWGDGLDAFYTMLRTRLPNAVLVGGVVESRGYTALNGTQLEGWPQRNLGKSATEDYREINGRMSTYSVQMHHGSVGPRYSEGINKMPTRLYPSQDDPNPPSNAAFRFSFGLMLLEDGYYGQQNWHVTDPWWDEYAVDTVSGSSTYGDAIASTPQDELLVRTHSGWMGFPQGPRYRVFDLDAFAAGRNLLPDGDFESGLGSWQGTNVSLRVDTVDENRLDGTGALRISGHTSYASDEFAAAAKGPTVRLTAGKEYTLAFGMKSSATRTIQVVLGDQSEQLYIPDTWSRQVFTFTAPRTDSYRLKFNVGREDTEVWIDSVYLFEGNADVFRRDFDNAVVVVNATPSVRTVDLGETLQRIRGTGQDTINSGETVTRVTIDPYDSAILVRPPN